MIHRQSDAESKVLIAFSFQMDICTVCSSSFTIAANVLSWYLPVKGFAFCATMWQALDTFKLITPGRLFQVESPIAKRLTQSKESVIIGFQAASRKDIAGGILGLATLRVEESAQ
jgi:hypothetical protein